MVSKNMVNKLFYIYLNDGANLENCAVNIQYSNHQHWCLMFETVCLAKDQFHGEIAMPML